jgi:hypothetical protein
MIYPFLCCPQCAICIQVRELEVVVFVWEMVFCQLTHDLGEIVDPKTHLCMSQIVVYLFSSIYGGGSLNHIFCQKTFFCTELRIVTLAGPSVVVAFTHQLLEFVFSKMLLCFARSCIQNATISVCVHAHGCTFMCALVHVTVYCEV